MGNSHISLSFPEASSKFSQAELQEVGRHFRRLVKASPDGRLHYTTLFKAVQKWYSHPLVYALFKSISASAGSSVAGPSDPGASSGHPSSSSSSAVADLSSSSTAPLSDSLLSSVPDISIDYEAFVKLICMICKCDMQGIVQILLDAFAEPAENHRFTRLTLHCALLNFSQSAAKTLGVDLLNETGKESQTEDEMNALISSLVTAAFNLITKPSLNFKETLEFFSRHPQFITYLRYGFQHFFHIPDKKEQPEDAVKGIPLPSDLARRLIPIPPKLLGVKTEVTILNPKMAATLVNWLPPKYRDTSLVQLYNTDHHGFSISTLLFTFERKHKALVKEACFILAQDHEDNVFGVFVPVPLQKHGNGKFYGDRSTFIFKLNPPPPAMYPASGRDQNFLFTTNDGGLGVGGSLGYHGFFLDSELKYGYFRRCETFKNAEVSETSAFKFQVKGVECWALMQNRRMEFYSEAVPEDDTDRDPDRPDVPKSSILNKASGADNFILQMIGGTGPTRDQHG